MDTYDVGQLERALQEHKDRVEDLKKEGVKFEAEVANIESRAKEAAALEESVEKLILRKSEALKNIDTFEDELRDKTALLKAYKEAFVIRSPLLPGDTFDELQMKNGTTLTNAKLLEEDAGRLKFSHSTGIGYYNALDLPDKLQKDFVLPPKTEDREVIPETIYAEKPQILMTYEEISEVSQQKYDKEREEMEEQRTAREEKFEKERAEMKEKREMERLEYEENKKKRAELFAKIDEYEDRARDLVRQKDAKIYEWKYANVKPSSGERDRILASYDAKIAQLRASIAEFREELAKY